MAIYLGNKMIGINTNTKTTHDANVSLQSLNINLNGYYNAPTNTAYNSITVDVLPTLKEIVIRPDAELIQTYSANYLLVEDKEVAFPEYNTTDTILYDTESLNPTISMSLDDYSYYIVIKALTIPIYNITSKSKGREEYCFSCHLYEIVDIPANNYKALLNGQLYASRAITANLQGLYRLLYWRSNSRIEIYDQSTGYGVYQSVSAPTITSNVLTINSPILRVRGNNTILSSTYYSAVTDARAEYLIQVYRAPKNYLNIDGWGLNQETLNIINCINNNNSILT